MIGKTVNYTKEDSRWSDFTGLVLDKVMILNSVYYLIQNSHNNEIDTVRYTRVKSIIPDKKVES